MTLLSDLYKKFKPVADLFRGAKNEINQHVINPISNAYQLAQARQNPQNMLSNRVSPQLQIKLNQQLQNPATEAKKAFAQSLYDQAVQPVIRSIPAIGMSVANQFGDKTTAVKPKPGLETKIFGTEPIRSYQGAVEKNTPLVQKYVKNPDLAKGIAGGGFLLGTLGNFVPGIGGKDKALEETANLISKATKAEDVTRLLKGQKITADAKLVEDLTKKNNPTKILETLKSKTSPSNLPVEAKITNKGSTPLQLETSQVLPPKSPVGKGDIPSTTPLEARLPNQSVSSDAIVPPTVRGGITPPELSLGKWRDKNALGLSRETLERNIDRVAGADAPKVKAFVTEPIVANETARANFTNNLRKEIRGVVDRLGIKLGSTEDKLIQRFGEGRMTLDELKQATPRWQQVSEGASYFRQKYDDLLNQVNAVRKQYGYQEIPKRADYFRHFQELGSTIDRLGVLFNEKDLPTGIAGITNVFKPGKPFTTAELQRKGGPFTESAIGGMDNYINAISKQIFHTDSVQRVRALEKYIRNAGNEGQAVLPNVVSNISEYGNLLAGKKALVDRGIESTLGRKSLGVMDWLRRRTSANMVGANISSALTNFIPFTQSLSMTSKTGAARGILETAVAPLTGKFNIIDGVTSGLLTRRFPESRIKSTSWQKIGDMANFIFELVDKFTSRSIVAGKYYENLQKGMDKTEAMKQADNFASRIIADRSWGQLPNLMSTHSLGPLTQFQTEVNNMYSTIIRDMPKEAQGSALKTVSSLAQFMIYSYIANNLYEKITGRRPTLDPINAGLTMIGLNDTGRGKSIGKRTTLAGKDLAENLPFMGGITGGRLPISSGLPNIFSAMRGDTSWKSELSKPAYLIAPPFGGNQLKKSIEGVNAYNQGASANASGNIRYPIEQNTSNKIKTAVFGQYATPEARNYFNSEQTPLNDKQTEKFKLFDPNQAKQYYEGIKLKQQNTKEQNKLKDELKKSGQNKAQAAEVDKYALAYDYQNAGDDPVATAKKLIKEKDIPSNIKDQLAERMGITDEVNTQLAIEEFKKSGKNYTEIGNMVYRKSKSGSVTSMSKVDYNTQLTTQKMENAKSAKNYKQWTELALQQEQNIIQQLNDPSLDELDKITLQQTYDKLLSDASKYAGYGGSFTKGKSVSAKRTKKQALYTKSAPSTVKFTYKVSAPKNAVSLKKAPTLPSNVVSKIGYSGVKAVKSPISLRIGTKRPRIIGRPKNLL